MIRYIVFTLLIFIAFACNSSKPEVTLPANVVSKDTMVDILVDVHILEATIDLGIMKSEIDLKQTDKYYPIFKKHNITRQEYDKSLLFYTSHPELLNQIYDNVIAGLSRKQAELNKH